MKKTLLGFCLAVLWAATAYAQEIEPYVSAFGGVSIGAEQEFVLGAPVLSDDPRPVAPGSWPGDTIVYKKKPMFGGAIGARVTASPVMRFRIEAEGARRKILASEFLGIRRKAFDAFYAARFDSDVSVVSGMANILWAPDINDRLQPYIGGGVGVARVNSNTRDINIDRPPGDICLHAFPQELHFFPKRFDGKDTVFSWQLIGGASTPITENISLFSEARYFRTGRNDQSGLVAYNDFNLCFPPAGEAPVNVSGEYKEVSATAGIRISF